MPVLNTNLNIRLTDGVSGPAKVVARSLVNIKDAALRLNGKSFGAGFVEPLRRAEVQMSAMAMRMRARARMLRGEVEGMQKGMHGLGVALAGLGIGHSMAHILGDGAELNRELLALKNAGRTTQDIAEGFAKASETIRKLPTTSLTENIKLLNETTGAFGNFHHALENLTFNAKLGSVMKSAFGDKFGDEGKAFNDLVRGFEIRGTAFDPAKYQEEAGRLMRAFIFTRGNVNPEQFLTFAQRSNPDIKGFSTEFLTEIAPSLIQTFGGDQAGTGLTAFEKVYRGGLTDRSQAKEWQRLGLVSAKAIQDNKGQSPGWRSGAAVGSDLAIMNPLDVMEKVVLPHIAAAGVDIYDPVALGKELDVLFKNKRARAIAYELGQHITRAALRKDQGLIRHVPNLDQQYENNLKDVYTALTALKAGFKDVWASLSIQFMQPAADGILGLAKGLQSLSAVLHEHPLLAQKLGLAAALTGAGAGVAALRASLRLLGVVGLNPLKMMKAALLDFGAYAVGGAALAIGGLRRGFLTLLNPIALVRASLIGLRATGRLLMTGVGLGTLLLASDFAVNNWKGIANFFASFGRTLKNDFAGSTGVTKAVVDGLTSLISTLGNITKEIPEEQWHSWGVKMADAVHRAVAALQNEDWASIGQKIGQGLLEGILEALKGIGGAIGSVISGAVPQFLKGGGGGANDTIGQRIGHGLPSPFKPTPYGYVLEGMPEPGQSVLNPGLHHGLRTSAGGHADLVDPALRSLVQRASLISGEPLSIYSGYRSPAHNAAVGGARSSLHMRGWATDLASPGHPKSDSAFWGKINGAMGQASRELGQPYRWGGEFGGKYRNDNDHFDLGPGGPAGPGKTFGYAPTIHVHVAGDLHHKAADHIAAALHRHYEDSLRASYADTGFG